MAEKENKASDKNSSRDKNLQIAIGQIEKSFGKGSIMRLGDTGAAQQDVPVISTGSLALDLALGIGGVPAGRIIEIFGPESSGKTTLCLHIIANAQAKGGRCAIIDAEHAIDPGYAKKIGVMFGNPETTTGGNALKFYASIRMDIRKTTVIKDPAGNIIGNRARVKVIKNKMAPPFRQAEFDIMYNEGISKAGSILDVATDMGILEKRGSWFSLDGEQLGQGRDQTKALIAGSPELQQKLTDRINAKIRGGEVVFQEGDEADVPAAAPEAGE